MRDWIDVPALILAGTVTAAMWPWLLLFVIGTCVAVIGFGLAAAPDRRGDKK